MITFIDLIRYWIVFYVKVNDGFYCMVVFVVIFYFLGLTYYCFFIIFLRGYYVIVIQFFIYYYGMKGRLIMSLQEVIN